MVGVGRRESADGALVARLCRWQWLAPVQRLLCAAHKAGIPGQVHNAVQCRQSQENSLAALLAGQGA